MKEENYLQVAPHTKDFTLLHCRNNWGVTSSLTCRWIKRRQSLGNFQHCFPKLFALMCADKRSNWKVLKAFCT